MNKRQFKKLYCYDLEDKLIGNPSNYSEKRKRDREGHELSIQRARKLHYSYWDMWHRPLPNRARLGTYISFYELK